MLQVRNAILHQIIYSNVCSVYTLFNKEHNGQLKMLYCWFNKQLTLYIRIHETKVKVLQNYAMPAYTILSFYHVNTLVIHLFWHTSRPFIWYIHDHFIIIHKSYYTLLAFKYDTQVSLLIWHTNLPFSMTH